MFLFCFFGTIICDIVYGSAVKEGSISGAEMTRIFFATTILFSFIKLLALMRIFNDFSFIIKMLTKVSIELMPFLLLFGSLIVVFAILMRSLQI